MTAQNTTNKQLILIEQISCLMHERYVVGVGVKPDDMNTYAQEYSQRVYGNREDGYNEFIDAFARYIIGGVSAI